MYIVGKYIIYLYGL